MNYQHRHSGRLGRREEKRLDSIFREIYFKKRKKSTVCDCKLILLHSHSVISYFFCTKTNLQNISTCMHGLRTYVRTGHDIMLIVAMQQKAQIEMRKTSEDANKVTLHFYRWSQTLLSFHSGKEK